MSGKIYRTVKINEMASRNCLSVIDIIKERYIFSRNPTVNCKMIIEAIKSKSSQEFSDTDNFSIFVSLYPIIKQFPVILNSHSHSNYHT